MHGTLTVVETDSKAAHDSCHKATIPQGARHVQRKALKMREFHHLRRATVALIKTDENAAALFTKALDKGSFIKFRDVMMNIHSPLRETLAAAVCQMHGDARRLADRLARQL